MQPAMDRLYRIAEPQAGYVTTAQAAEVGVSRQELYYLSRTGELRHVAYGIQRLARFPSSPHEDIVVACLWAGDEAVASYETAFVVYGIGEAMPATIHITTPNRFRGRRPGVRVHHEAIDPDERAHFEGVPVTAPVRTIADVARQSPSDARAALRDALDRRLIRRGQLHTAAVKYPHARAVLGVTS